MYLIFLLIFLASGSSSCVKTSPQRLQTAGFSDAKNLRLSVGLLTATRGRVGVIEKADTAFVTGEDSQYYYGMTSRTAWEKQCSFSCYLRMAKDDSFSDWHTFRLLNRSASDTAVIFFQFRKRGVALEPLSISKAKVPISSVIRIAGFPNLVFSAENEDNLTNTLVSARGYVTANDPDQLATTAHTRPGSRGGPILAFIDNEYVAIGVHTSMSQSPSTPAVIVGNDYSAARDFWRGFRSYGVTFDTLITTTRQHSIWQHAKVRSGMLLKANKENPGITSIKVVRRSPGEETCPGLSSVLKETSYQFFVSYSESVASLEQLFLDGTNVRALENFIAYPDKNTFCHTFPLHFENYAPTFEYHEGNNITLLECTNETGKEVACAGVANDDDSIDKTAAYEPNISANSQTLQ